MKAGIDTSDLLGSTYQLDKFEKHTIEPPSTTYPVQSKFDSSSTSHYEYCINETIENGFVEIDHQGNKNILYCPSTGSSLGTRYKWGQEASKPDTIVVVNTSEGSAIHSLLKDSDLYQGKCCKTCGNPLL